ncbi:MAG TPA: hypothetical protein VN920_11670, partial [Pyrinomonadaceae bacterium]|nr:hypothetical protein [Pyrinomonadaceae bacterium]
MRPKILSLVTLAIIVGAGLIVYSKTRVRQGPYDLAQDMPRGALVYAQFKDLSALLKQWDGSSLKQQYLGSTNYAQFQHRHLALKLVQRWTELNDGLGFQLDSASLGEAAEVGAAIAIYDIGRLDLVFIAPLSKEKLAATKFFKSKTQFEETELPDGTTYYRREVLADRGRQKQVLSFSTVKGRFVLATSERLLLRTIANIYSKTGNDRLSEDPGFKTLSAALTPHFAIVWVDQAKLNDDWYFKHYWLMQNVAQLKGIRACMFDLEFQNGKWTERRDFLTAQRSSRVAAGISAAEVQRLRALIPDRVPFLKLQSLNNDSALAATLASVLVRDTLLDRLAREQGPVKKLWSWQSYDDAGFYPDEECEDSSGRSYTYLNSDYDSVIDDPRDARLSERQQPGQNPLNHEIEKQFLTRLEQVLGPARPLAAAMATNPRTIAGPLFAEFQRVAIVTLQTPASLKREALEDAISKLVQGRLTVAGPSVDLKWVNHEDGSRTWRELKLAVLDWKLCYAQQDRDLILANSPELLATVLDNRDQQPASELPSVASLDDLIVIRFDQRKQAFDDILGRLDAEETKRRQ